MPKTPNRVVRIEDSLWFRAKVVAASKGETVTDVIRRALVNYVRRNK